MRQCVKESDASQSQAPVSGSAIMTLQRLEVAPMNLSLFDVDLIAAELQELDGLV
jgi:hypothetical protein